jgi:hypothetical protein
VQLDARHDLGDSVDQAEQAEQQRQGDRADVVRTLSRINEVDVDLSMTCALFPGVAQTVEAFAVRR